MNDRARQAIDDAAGKRALEVRLLLDNALTSKADRSEISAAQNALCNDPDFLSLREDA